MNDIFIALAGAIVDLLRRRPALRLALTLVALASVIGAAIAQVLARQALLQPEMAAAVRDGMPPIIALGVVALFLCLVSYTELDLFGTRALRIDLDNLREERSEIQERMREQATPDVMDTIRLGLNQITEYYTINKSQARSSFRFSVFAVVAGLVTIIGGVWIFYRGPQKSFELTAVATVAGILIEFIGGAYFYLYRRSLEQLNLYFGQLVRMQDTMLSVRLCESITPEERKMELKQTIILTLLDRDFALTKPRAAKRPPSFELQTKSS